MTRYWVIGPLSQKSRNCSIAFGNSISKMT